MYEKISFAESYATPPERTNLVSGTSHLSVTGNEIRKLGYNLYIRISPDQMKCHCSYIPTDKGSMMTRGEFETYLRQYNVYEGIDLTALERFAISAAAGKQLVDVLVASGTLPIHGADERMEIKARADDADLRNEDGTVNMYRVQTFINVNKDDEIGIVFPAEEGTPGRNILGRSIPPVPGKPMRVKIGRNVRRVDGGRLIASITGRFVQTPFEISVEDEYIVHGNVNFRVGIIDFKGVVDVRGEIRDHFDVKATKGVKVFGNIGACNINTDGNVTFCGMDGRNKGCIIAGGNIYANYLHDVTIECAGDVVVAVEIHNCSIKVLGKVVVDKGAIMGGICIALGGIESKTIGSKSSSTPTILNAGNSYFDLNEINGIMAEMEKVQWLYDCSVLLSERTKLKEEIEALSDRIVAIRNKEYPNRNAKINVKHMMHENTQITIGASTEVVKEKISAGTSVIENSLKGGFRYLPFTNLFVRATDIERSIMSELEQLNSAG